MSEAKSKGQAQWILLAVATALAVYLTWKMVEPFVSILVWAGVLAILFFPLQQRLARRTRRPALAAALSLLVVLATVIVPLGVVGTLVTSELARFAANAQTLLAPYVRDPGHGGHLQRALDWLHQRLPFEATIDAQKLSELLARASETLLKGTVNVLGGAVGVFAKLLLVLFTLFYLLRDGERIRTALPGVLPLERGEAEALLSRTGEIIHASVAGTLIIAVVQGTLGGIAFAVLGLPSPLLWGVVMVLMSFIPLVGSSLVWLPAALVLGANDHWMKAAALAVWGVVAIAGSDNLLRPRLVGHRTRMHELTVFFSVLGGIQLFGLLGLLVGPVVFAVTRGLFEVFRRDGTSRAEPAAAT